MYDDKCFTVRQAVAANCGCDDWECDCDAHLQCANKEVTNLGIVGNTALDNIMACVKSELEDPSEEDDEEEEDEEQEQEQQEQEQEEDQDDEEDGAD